MVNKSIEQLQMKVKRSTSKIVGSTVALLLCGAAIAGLTILNPTFAPFLVNIAGSTLGFGICGCVNGIVKGVNNRNDVIQDYTCTKLSYRRYKKLEKSGELLNWLNRNSTCTFESKMNEVTSKTEGAALSPEDAEYLRTAINTQNVSNIEAVEQNNAEPEKQTDEEREI